MGHHCGYNCRFEIEKNDIVLITTAYYKDYMLDVYKEYLLSEKSYCRNVFFSYLAGYTITFPEEKIYKFSKEKMGLEKWGFTESIKHFRYGQYYQHLEDVYNMFLKVDPELKYFCMKYKNDAGYCNLFEVARNYKSHPECETLLELGLTSLAMNQTLYKLTKPKLKEILNVIQLNKNIICQETRLKDIQVYLKEYKNKMSFSDYWRWYVIANTRMDKWGVKIDYQDWKYLMKQSEKSKGKIQINKYEFNDYLDMCKKVGHDINDPYWRYPNNFRKNHDLVMEQIRSVSAAKLTLQQDFLKKVCKSMLKYNTEINGYKIFIPVEAIEWQKTCDILYQCLIRNGYMKKVINQESIIIFIWKDNNPIATAEIDYKKNILQFYGDERGHIRGENCKPSDEVIEIFNFWLETFKPKKEKFEIKDNMHYYKGFEAIDGLTLHTCVGAMDGKGKGSSFVIGNIYETPFEDEEIIEAGGIGCVSTNKVFHFCNSITEISRHYHATVYCEIKPLGAIVEHDGALLSNKIEILKVLSEQEVNYILEQEKGANLCY